MNTRPSNLAYIILILLIVVVIYLLYLVSKLGTFIREANPTVITACIGGFFTITLSIVSVFIGRYLEKKKMIEAEIRNKKIPVYEDFIKGVLVWILKKDKDKNPDELTVLVQEFSQKIIIWGNQKIIKKWVEFRSNSNTSDGKKMIHLFEQLILEIRKDIGQENSELITGDIMSIFINDYKEYMTK